MRALTAELHRVAGLQLLAITLVLAILVALAHSLAGCKAPNTPDAGDVEAGIVVVEAGCKFIESITNDGTVKSVCATVEEISEIAKLILGARSPDAGRASIGPCKQLTQDVCATPEEISRGIDHIAAQRRARLARDAGR